MFLEFVCREYKLEVSEAILEIRAVLDLWDATGVEYRRRDRNYMVNKLKYRIADKKKQTGKADERERWKQSLQQLAIENNIKHN